LKQMVECWINSDHPEAREQFLNMIFRCPAPHHIAFLASLFTPSAGPDFFILLQKAIVAFSGVVPNRSAECISALSGVFHHFDFSRWFVSQPAPTDDIIDNAQDLLVDAFCCAPAFSNTLQDYVRASLETILATCSYLHLSHFLTLALRYSLPLSTQFCRVCCYPSAMWSVTSGVRWNTLTATQRSVVLQSMIRGLSEIKQSIRSSLLRHVSCYLTAILGIIHALQPSPNDPQRCSRDGALMLGDSAMKLYSLFFTCTNINDTPWSESSGGDAANARQLLLSIFSLVGACSQFSEDQDTSSLVLENAWNVLTDDGNGMIGIHSFESEFPPPYVQNVLFEAAGSALPWFLWCPQSVDIQRIKALLTAGNKPLICQSFNRMVLSIMLCITRSDSPAMSLQHTYNDIVLLAICLAQSFARCNDPQVGKKIEVSLVNSMNSLGLEVVPDDDILQICETVESLFAERVKNRDTVDLCSSSPISFLLSMVLAAGGIKFPGITSSTCDAVIVTPQCTPNRLRICVTAFGNALSSMIPASASTEQQVLITAIKVFLTAINKVFVREEASAKSAPNYIEGLNEVTNVTNVFERIAAPLLVLCLGCPVGAVKEATSLAIKACLTEEAGTSAQINILHVLTSVASSAATNGRTRQVEVPMSVIVQLSSEAVNTYFNVSNAWAPLVDAFSVPNNALAEFIARCVQSGEGHLLHLVWLTTENTDRDRFIEILMSWIDAVSVAQSGSRGHFCLLLLADLFMAIVPPSGTAFGGTKQYVGRLTQLLTHLDKMHNDKTNKLLGYLHIGERTSCSIELQLASSVLSQFLQVCLYTFDGTDGKPNTLVRTNLDDPYAFNSAVQKHNKAFVQHALSPELINKFGNENMTSFVKNVTEFLQAPSNTICSWRILISLLVQHLYPSSLILAELKTTP